MARRRKPPKPAPPAWTPNQIVAHNIAKARQLRGWTQDQAAEACAPYLGARLSPASWSALERSVDGGRIREITADELVAFARAFDLPIGFFLTPPSAWDNHVVATPDAGRGRARADRAVRRRHRHRRRTSPPGSNTCSPGPPRCTGPGSGPDGRMENLGRVEPDVHPRLAGPAAVRARLLLREQFGDLDQARDVLSRLSTILAALDEPEPDDTDEPEPARRSGGRHEARE